MNECIFCSIVSGASEASIVYQDTVCTAFMDIVPITPGHVLIVPNQHAVTLEEMDESTASHLFGVAHKISKALRNTSIKCEGINIFIADGVAAGQEVLHVHLHVFARFADDGFCFPKCLASDNSPRRIELDTLAQHIQNKM